MSLLVVGPSGLSAELASVREALLTNAEETQAILCAFGGQ